MMRPAFNFHLVTPRFFLFFNFDFVEPNILVDFANESVNSCYFFYLSIPLLYFRFIAFCNIFSY